MKICCLVFVLAIATGCAGTLPLEVEFGGAKVSVTGGFDPPATVSVNAELGIENEVVTAKVTAEGAVDGAAVAGKVPFLSNWFGDLFGGLFGGDEE